MWVIKLGGSLLWDAALADWVGACVRVTAEGTPLVVCPGGGVFADYIRATDKAQALGEGLAHDLAILAMRQTATVIQHRYPHLTPCPRISDLPRAAGTGALWFPDPMDPALRQVAASWTVSADTLALEVARQLGANGLIVVKSAAPAHATGLPEQVKAGWIDAAFPAASADFGHPIRWALADESHLLDVLISANGHPDRGLC